MMRIVINDLMYGACQAFNMAPSLTHGAAHLIESFGSRELKERFIPRMFSGQWAGTMALTEPQAGSNLAAIRTRAIPEGDHYRIKGSKIFISWGDHDLAENIIHLLLARIGERPRASRAFPFSWCPRSGSTRTAPWGIERRALRRGGKETGPARLPHLSAEFRGPGRLYRVPVR